MKVFKLITCLMFILNQINGQYLTQSTNGKSSIPLPLNGVGIGIDIGKSQVAFGINNYEKVLKNNSSSILFGLNVSGKNSNGLANLFSSGTIVPEGDALGFLGYSISNNKKLIRKFQSSEVKKLTDEEEEAQKKIFEQLKEKVILSVVNASELIDDTKIRQQKLDEISDSLKKITESGTIEKYMKYVISSNPSLKIFTAKLDIELKEVYKISRREYKENTYNFTSKRKGAFSRYLNGLCPIRFTTFLLGGISGRNFTRYLGLVSPNFSKSFQDTLFKGTNIGLALNFQIKNYWFGITYSYVNGDNFINLTSKDYTIRTTDTSGNQALISEKKKTAYSGKYSKVETNELNIDLVGEYKLSDSSRLLINPYSRSSLFSRDTSYLKNYTNIGVGFYFIGKKSKFLGGFYIELPDVNNNIEKAKLADQINILPPYKKLTFGIVAKINLSSIFSFSNEPDDSD